MHAAALADEGAAFHSVKGRALADQGNPSPSEWAVIVTAAAGVFAAVFKVIGGAAKWLGSTTAKVADRRETKLNRWHDELQEREREIKADSDEFHNEIRRELGVLKVQLRAVNSAFQLVATELRLKDPANPALRQAEELFKLAFPIQLDLPEDLLMKLARIEAADRASATGRKTEPDN